MITVEDFNSILLKYGHSNIFYEIDFNLIEQYPVQYDFCTIEIETTQTGKLFVKIDIKNSFWTGHYYYKKNGEITFLTTLHTLQGTFGFYPNSMDSLNDLVMVLHLCASPTTPYGFNDSGVHGLVDLGIWGFIPLQSTRIAQFGDEINNKIYIQPLGRYISDYTINGEVVPLEQDAKGKYLTITDTTDGTLGVIGTDGYHRELYELTFKKYRTIPQTTIDPLYLGCKNELKVYFDGTETDKYEAHYQGNLLKDKIIDLRNDLTSSDVNLTIKITAPNYYNTSLQVNALCEMFSITNQDDLEEALDNEYSTITFASAFDVENVTFDYPLTIVDSELSFADCIFSSDLTLKNCTITLKDEDYMFNNLTLDNVTLTKDDSVDGFGYIKVVSQLDCFDSDLTGIFIYCGENATFNNDSFTNSLIFSDNKINISNSSFAGEPISDYPNMLYLTGSYNVTNNNFALSGEFEELTFNICIIKTTSGFNADNFIGNNNYDVNITVAGHHYESFFYCLVDDDTIYSKG